MPRSSLWASALLLTVGCRAGSPAPLTDPQRTAIADSVRQAAAALAAGVSAHGDRAFPPAMDSAPGYLWAYNGFVAFPSFDSMVAWTHAAPEAKPGVFAWDGSRVEVLAPGVATFAAAYSETRPDSAGKPRTEMGYFTAVAVHREGGWKFTNAHTSTLPPPPPPSPPRPAARRR